ncbi:hypothetical protein N1031_17160 [Herbiconiux moechotypicola]|uniref:PqqD family peptide modification chaperone n=1 Tax=Herbiconiux moechotypicola TaxID=637393 RepID=A0ABN3DR30_9MICO|nr:hypothetical protein [Herbiconiux moechotypicola]MCS5731493.1 hypothetical protein [Herbiconiux moechotypicola]
MTGDVRVDALGATVGLAASALGDDLDTVARLWNDSVSTAHADVMLSVGLTTQGGFDVSAPDLHSLAAALSTRVTLAAIELRKSELVMLHACGVAADDGRVVAFVGPSGRGKTTLAKNVAQHFGYVTDETVGIGEDGTVYPYRKPLSIIDDPSNPGRKSQVAPESLGLLPLPDAPLSIGAVVLLDRVAEHVQEPQVSAVPMREALVSMVPELSYLPELPRPLQRLAALIDAIGGICALRYSEADTVATVVPTLLERPAAIEGWSVVPPSTHAEAPSAGEYLRVLPLDQLQIGAEYVVLHGRHVHVLDGIGPAVWDALATPSSAAQVVDAVVARHGRPEGEDPQVLVQAALDALLVAGLVHVGE